jgi:hypothetical protein
MLLVTVSAALINFGGAASLLLTMGSAVWVAVQANRKEVTLANIKPFFLSLNMQYALDNIEKIANPLKRITGSFSKIINTNSLYILVSYVKHYLQQ